MKDKSLGIEKLVVKNSLSMRLKELGVPQESLFVWHSGDILVGSERFNDKVSMPCQVVIHKNLKSACSAFLTGELLEMLPKNYLLISSGKVWHCGLVMDYERPLEIEETLSETSSNACAKMLIHLIENKIIKKEELK